MQLRPKRGIKSRKTPKISESHQNTTEKQEKHEILKK